MYKEGLGNPLGRVHFLEYCPFKSIFILCSRFFFGGGGGNSFIIGPTQSSNLFATSILQKLDISNIKWIIILMKHYWVFGTFGEISRIVLFNTATWLFSVGSVKDLREMKGHDEVPVQKILDFIQEC